MPRFFFDVLQNDRLSIDEVGTELDSPDGARIEATQAIAEIAKDALPGSRRAKLQIRVRDANGVNLFELELRFSTLDLEQPGAG